MVMDATANPFCSNRSTAGDACGECEGCKLEGARISREVERIRRVERQSRATVRPNHFSGLEDIEDGGQ